jgi:hypothetical protein
MFADEAPITAYGTFTRLAASRVGAPPQFA